MGADGYNPAALPAVPADAETLEAGSCFGGFANHLAVSSRLSNRRKQATRQRYQWQTPSQKDGHQLYLRLSRPVLD